jgi:UDP-N-acetylglucosamine diphosphorylase / glucose-1-phosphate thymidylyltransferase / UDP-N-acetylgalactosamine diphosphorylase / glucosamine-1-phosphate N-acetyltransferase / galactosamine-1-phosphate N-acetyltransferase
MKAVILCAGKSTRTYPLTVTRPKPLLQVANKTLLEHALDQLVAVNIEEVILVVGYKHEMIRAYVEELKQKKQLPTISYVEQTEQKGTGHALIQARDKLTEPFLLLHGDDLYFADDIQKLLAHDNAMLVHPVSDPRQFGVCLTKEGGKLERIVEKPTEHVGDNVNIGCYKLHPDLFVHGAGVLPSDRGEIEIVDMITALTQHRDVMCVRASRWLPIPYSWSLLAANAYLLSRLKPKNEGVIEHHVTIKGAVSVGRGTVIKAGTYIEGPVVIGEKCTIGPNAYIRAPTSIGDRCKIGASVEIKNCVVMNNSNVPHLSYVGDSILGENVNVGAGAITANVRHDTATIKTMVKGELVDTGLTKFGTVVGDNARIGINTCIYPGRKIWSGCGTVPGAQVTKDIENNTA